MIHALLSVIALVLSVAAADAYDFTPGVSLSVSEEYNDNVFLAKTDKKSDFITRVTPAVFFSLGSAQSSLSASYSPSFNYYRSHTELNKTSHSASARGNLAVSEEMNVTVSDTFVLTNEPRSLTAVADLGPLRERREQRVNNLDGSITYKLKGNLIFLIGGSYLDTDFSNQGANDVKTYSETTGLTYRMSERSSLSLNAKYTQYDYKAASDAQSQDYTLGFTYRITPTLGIGLTGGAVSTKIDDTGRRTTGFSGGAELSQRFGKGNATLAFRQTVVPGVETGEPLTTRAASINLSRPVTNLLDISVLASYIKYKSAGGSARDAEEVRGGANLVYKIRPWAGAGVSYYYVNLDDKTVSARGYSNHIVVLTLRLSYTKGSNK